MRFHQVPGKVLYSYRATLLELAGHLDLCPMLFVQENLSLRLWGLFMVMRKFDRNHGSIASITSFGSMNTNIEAKFARPKFA